VSTHYEVKQGSSTLGYAVYDRGNVLFTPAPRVASKVAGEVWYSLDQTGEWPAGVFLQRWEPKRER